MLIKICGITHPDDAHTAVYHGADWIGMIFCQKSKRLVSLSTAREITQVATQHGAKPVAVFVEQNGDEIMEICEATGIRTVQLHGDVSKQAIDQLLPHFEVIDVCRVGHTKLSTTTAKWILCDSAEGGSGKTFDWDRFQPPRSSHWILAGGLNPVNVAEAVKRLRPDGIDVSSGVEKPGTVRKDPLLIQQFIKAIKED